MKRARPPGQRGQTWKTFVENHADDIWACDFLQLREYAENYFNKARPHQGLSQRIPGADGVEPPAEARGHVIALPVLGGLHHDCRRAA